MKALRVFVLAALLGGCATVPPPVSQPSETGPASAKAARDAGRASTRAQAVGREAARTKAPGRVDAQAQHCVALAMYWEARGEGQEGMLAVGSVVLNRVEDDRFPDSACGVVYQGGETPPCQFSWWCDGKSDRPTHEAAWARSLGLAHELLTARPNDPTGGALFFHSASMQAPWRRERTARIGNHVFYR